MQKLSPDWMRNHHENKGNGIAGEMVDVLMMDTAIGIDNGIDPLLASLDKVVEKRCSIMPEGRVVKK